MTPPKLSRQQTKVRNAIRARTIKPPPPKRYVISERQLAEAFAEWIRRRKDNAEHITDGAAAARYLLAIIGELAANYKAENT